MENGLTKEQELEYRQTIEDLKKGREFPEKVKKLMETELFKEVIDEIYMKSFAQDLIFNYAGWSEEQQKVFDEEYKVRSRFYETISTWAKLGEQADLQIARIEELLEETSEQA